MLFSGFTVDRSSYSCFRNRHTNQALLLVFGEPLVGMSSPLITTAVDDKKGKVYRLVTAVFDIKGLDYKKLLKNMNEKYDLE